MPVVAQYNFSGMTATAVKNQYPIGYELKQKAESWYTGVYNTQSGIGPGSCRCGVAITQTSGYGDIAYGNQFYSILVSNSRLFRGMDHLVNNLAIPSGNFFSSSDLEQHAEQVALEVISNPTNNMTLFRTNYQHGNQTLQVSHIYTTLAPCTKCATWYQGITTENFIVYYG